MKFFEVIKKGSRELIQDSDLMFSVLSYWFGTEEVLEKGSCGTFSYFDDLYRQKWFAKGSLQKEVDDCIKNQFQSLMNQAENGEKDFWTTCALGSLCLIILLDQFPRNIYRGTAKAFKTDEKALHVCVEGLNSGYLEELQNFSLIFGCQYAMPLIHAEDLQLQQKSVDIFNNMLEHAIKEQPATKQIYERFLVIAKRHLEHIKNFSKFPERNQYLGRESTLEELSFLENTLFMPE